MQSYNVQKTMIHHEKMCKGECEGAFVFEKVSHDWFHGGRNSKAGKGWLESEVRAFLNTDFIKC